MKTAVEWLAEQVNSAKWKFADVTDRNSIIEQAKQMEKEQIVKAHFDGCEIGEIFAYENREFITDSEQYYNKKFKK